MCLGVFDIGFNIVYMLVVDVCFGGRFLVMMSEWLVLCLMCYFMLDGVILEEGVVVFEVVVV